MYKVVLLYMYCHLATYPVPPNSIQGWNRLAPESVLRPCTACPVPLYSLPCRTAHRLKKYQYLMYKHCLLHGLNISLALSGRHIAGHRSFRLYWLSLNAAYVLEFFLQTLVKKGYMRQGAMLALNQLLMLITTLPALWVLQHVSPALAALALALNLLSRGHELRNVLLTTAAGVAWHLLLPQ